MRARKGSFNVSDAAVAEAAVCPPEEGGPGDGELAKERRGECPAGAGAGPLQPPCSPSLGTTWQVGADIRCTSRGRSPSQTLTPVWTPALAQVKGPGRQVGVGGLTELPPPPPGFSGLIVQPGAFGGVSDNPFPAQGTLRSSSACLPVAPCRPARSWPTRRAAQARQPLTRVREPLGGAAGRGGFGLSVRLALTCLGNTDHLPPTPTR